MQGKKWYAIDADKWGGNDMLLMLIMRGNDGWGFLFSIDKRKKWYAIDAEYWGKWYVIDADNEVKWWVRVPI